ncbi:MAG: T9SS type A sorting domain-containing protein [Dysgonomonas sp.]
MRKILLSFLMLGVLLSASAQTNLVLNGDFEEWDFMSGNPKSWSRYISADVAKSTDAQSGSYSANMEADDFGYYMSYITSDAFNLKAGKSYSCSFYYKIIKGDISSFYSSLQSFEGVFPEDLVATDITDFTLDVWKKVEFSYTSTEDKQPKFYIFFRSTNDANILIDNVVVAEANGSSIEANVASDLFRIYPEYIALAADKVQSADIYSIDGKVYNVARTDANTIDLSSVPTGVYVLNVLSTDSKAYKTKFLKK